MVAVVGKKIYMTHLSDRTSPNVLSLDDCFTSPQLQLPHLQCDVMVESTPLGCTILKRLNKAETAVHGRGCLMLPG